jgi:hypothetical protein
MWDNAQPLIECWKNAGGRVRIFPKEGADHHPHGLKPPDELIDLLCAEWARKSGD